MKHLVFLWALLVVAQARGQLTVDSYRAEVSAYSHELKIAEEQVTEAAEQELRTRTNRLPELSAAGVFSVAMRQHDGVKPWSFSLEPAIVQTLYAGGSLRADRRRAALAYGAALEQQTFTRFDVRYAADYAYRNLAAMRSYEVVTAEYVGLVDSLKRVVDLRFAEGYTARGDVLMMEAQLAQARYDLTVAGQQSEVALHNFNILRGHGGDEGVVLAQSILDSPAMPRRVALGEVLARRNDLEAARLQSLSAEEAVRQARAPFLPRLGVGVSGQWHPHTPNRTGRTLVDGAVVAEVSVPIFHWGERRHAVSAARAAAVQQERRVEQLRDEIIRQELNGWTAVEKSVGRMVAVRENLRIARENLDLSAYSYGEGLVTILDVLQAQLNWIQLYTHLIDAYYAYAVAVADYERVVAEP